MTQIIDMFPYARDKAMLDVEKKRVGLYHLISVIMMYNRTEDDKTGWMFIKPIYRFELGKRIDAMKKEKELSGQLVGEVIPFPQKKGLIEYAKYTEGEHSPPDPSMA